MRTTDRPSPGRGGFSFTEVVLAVVLLSYMALLAVPITETNQRRISEFEARQALREIRTAVDRYHEVSLRKGMAIDDPLAYPPTLGALVGNRHLRHVPVDPLTGAPDWVTISTTDEVRSRDRVRTDGRNVFDVRTRATGTTLDGVNYADL